MTNEITTNNLLDPDNAKMEYDMLKAMVPIYVFHRSQGQNEDAAYRLADKEMRGLIKRILKNHVKPDQQ